jgi:hypothetical protein
VARDLGGGGSRRIPWRVLPAGPLDWRWTMSTDPIIKGGQGRSECDITSGAEVLVTIGVVVAVLMLAKLVWWLCGGGA